MMIAFTASSGARFICRTDRSLSGEARLDFCSLRGEEIPLHLSLRFDEGLLVLNRRSARGWHREIPVPHRFEGPVSRLELCFGRAWVTVHLDGVRIGRFDAWPRYDRAGRLKLRRGFPGLGRIRGVLIGGAVCADSLDAGAVAAPQRLRGGADLWLTRRLELVAPLARDIALPGPEGGELALLPLPAGGFGWRATALRPVTGWSFPAPIWSVSLRPSSARGGPGAMISSRCK